MVSRPRDRQRPGCRAVLLDESLFGCSQQMGELLRREVADLNRRRIADLTRKRRTEVYRVFRYNVLAAGRTGDLGYVT